MSAPTSLRGSLEATSLPELLRPLVRAKKTGVLRVERGGRVKTLYVSEGRLIFATSTDPDDRLGEMLLKKGRIGYRALEDSVLAIQAGKRQGTILVESGAIRSKDLVDGVTEQVQEIIYGLFQADAGDYSFAEGDLPSREVIVLRMSTGDIVREGVRRIQRWSRIRTGVGGLEQVYALAPDSAAVMGGLSLRPEEVALIASLDGPTTVEDLCRGARQPDFEVCRSLWGLWAAAVLDRVPQDVAAPPPRDHTEPHAERMTGASIGREIDRFNQLHRFVSELVHYELREQAAAFFERAFGQVGREFPELFDGIAVDGHGELDPIALRHNIVSREVARYLNGLDRLLEVELSLARELLGDRKAAIIQDGLLTIKQQQLERRPAS